MAEKTLMVGYDNPDKKLEINRLLGKGNKLASLSLTLASNQEYSLTASLSAGLQSDLLKAGNAINVYANYYHVDNGVESDNPILLGIYELDSVIRRSNDGGRSLDIVARSVGVKRIGQWKPDCSFDLWSQVKQSILPHAEGATKKAVYGMVRGSGIWGGDDNHVRLKQLNQPSVLFTTERASRGSMIKARFSFTDAVPLPRFCTAAVGVVFNYYRETKAEAAARLGKAESELRDNEYGNNFLSTELRTNAAGKICTTQYVNNLSIAHNSTWWSADAVQPAPYPTTDFWLMSHFQDGNIKTYYRLDSSPDWVFMPFAASTLVDFRQKPWRRQDFMGRGGILMNVDVPTTTHYGISSQSSLLPVKSVANLTPGEHIKMDEEIARIRNRSSDLLIPDGITLDTYVASELQRLEFTNIGTVSSTYFTYNGNLYIEVEGERDVAQEVCYVFTAGDNMMLKRFAFGGMVNTANDGVYTDGPLGSATFGVFNPSLPFSPSAPVRMAFAASDVGDFLAIPPYNGAWVWDTYRTDNINYQLTKGKQYCFVYKVSPPVENSYHGDNRLVYTSMPNGWWNKGACKMYWRKNAQAAAQLVDKVLPPIILEGWVNVTYFGGENKIAIYSPAMQFPPEPVTKYDGLALYIYEGPGKGTWTRIKGWIQRANTGGLFVTETDISQVVKSDSKMMLCPVIELFDRGARGTSPTSHGYGGALSVYTEYSPRCSYFEYYSTDMDWRLADMLKEIAGKAGVTLRCETARAVLANGAETEMPEALTPDNEIVYYSPQRVNKNNLIVKITPPFLGEAQWVGVQFRDNGLTGDNTRALTVAVGRSLITNTYHVYLFSITGTGMTLLQDIDIFPQHSPQTGCPGRITFSVQENVVSVWICDQFAAAFSITGEQAGWTGFARVWVVGVTGEIAVDWSELDERVDNFILDMGVGGLQLMSDLLKEKRVFFQDAVDENGKPYVRAFRNRKAINTAENLYVLTTSTDVMSTDNNIATRIMLDGIDIVEDQDDTLLREVGNIFYYGNSERMDTRNDMLAEIGKIFQDMKGQRNAVVLSGALDPRIEPNDIVLTRAYGADGVPAVKEIVAAEVKIGIVGGDSPKADMEVNGYERI